MLGTAMHVTCLGDGAALYGRYLPISITCEITICYLQTSLASGPCTLPKLAFWRSQTICSTTLILVCTRVLSF